MPPKREFKPRTRRSAFRDASLVVIATEGQNPERRYFLDLVSQDHYPNPRVHVEVIQTSGGATSPVHVMAALDGFKREYELRAYDELWMVVDRDRWGSQELATVAAQCQQKNYKLAVSNPCFELWILLHRKSIDQYSPSELKMLEQNPRVSTSRNYIEQELLRILGSYNKTTFDPSLVIPDVEFAINQARTLDLNPEYRWPQSLGTRVYRLAERILPGENAG